MVVKYRQVRVIDEYRVNRAHGGAKKEGVQSRAVEFRKSRPCIRDKSFDKAVGEMISHPTSGYGGCVIMGGGGLRRHRIERRFEVASTTN